MSTKGQALRRLNILSFLFFGLIIGSVLLSISSRDFREGYKEGFQKGSEVLQNSKNKIFSHTLLEIPLIRKANTFTEQQPSTTDSTILLDARPVLMDVRLSSVKPLFTLEIYGSMLLMMGGFSCQIAIVIILILMLLSIRKSVKYGNIFNSCNIALSRSIGILLIAGSVFQDLSSYLNIHLVKRLAPDMEWNSALSMFSFQDILTGILILIIAEIFAIGYDLTEEQKLTI